MNRETLEVRATDYAKGFKTGYDVASAEVETREQAAYDKGFRDGVAHAGRVQWQKLFTIVVVGSTIGCGIILAIAVGFSLL